jgi:hypothetical protein
MSMLRSDKQRTLDYTEQVSDAGEITFLDLDYWVIFDYLRDEPRFREIERTLEAKVKMV